jgi:nicotinate-nucleotide adenylyltransferase
MEIALFGGSFDPPHVGHLLAAAYVLATEPVDELWFVPVFGHPLGKPLQAPFEHRAHLTELAIADLGLSRARVARVEAELGGEGRTADLLEHLHRQYPDRKWALVLGSDLAAERPQWKRFDRIEQLARIIPLERAGFPVPGGAGPLLPEVSSTQVRKLLASGGDASHLVPRPVLRAILAAGTYGMTRPA